MKKEYILLLIIPICFVLLSLNLRSAEGPFYNGSADPSYVYLFNSMILAQMDGADINHVDHPGTPLQIAGAIVIKVYYLLTHDKNDLAEDVIYRPEAYLNVINFSLILLNALGLYIMGLIIFSINKNLLAALLFQTIPFISINITEVFSLVKPESFVFFIAAILISLMLKFVYDPPDKINSYVIGVGILCGFILAAKISFLCLILLPLILFPGIRNKMIFSLTALLSFIVFVLPAISNTGYFMNWVGGLIFKDGRYGTGNPSILNFNSFTNNITKIFVNEKFFAAVYLISFLIILISFIIKITHRNADKRNKSGEEKFLFAIFLSMTVQIIFVAKHYSQRYMFPALILTIPAMFIIVKLLYEKYFPGINTKTVFGSILILTLLFSAYNYRKIFARTKMISSETAKLNNFINENYQNADVILSSGASSESVGLILGYSYSGIKVKQDFLKKINERFPDYIVYDFYNNKIFSSSESVEIQKILDKGKPVLLQTIDENYNDEFIDNLEVNFAIKNITLKKVYSNATGESLFELAK